MDVAPRPDTLATTRRSPARPLWFALACVCVAIGAVGVIVPGLPTTPFLLVAGMAAARSSPRLHAWLTGHRVFGPTIHNWNEHRAVTRSAKSAATAAMLASGGVLFIVAGNGWPTLAAIVTMAIVGTWLWRRPTPESGH